ncbi:conserved hypothetical protein [Leadbettera azotonutricia ZAS-9]|uniref:Uncharacterized protein n=2 Tax=Leadbettera azotonutricia TaxID=150829 RepID=F5YE37_LEAAZ|nr:conserved hypothetical protein [Leadbettera azotonutricia ZAS-9]
MQAERDYLVMKIFPSIRRYCEERDISFVELDLRTLPKKQKTFVKALEE